MPLVIIYVLLYSANAVVLLSRLSALYPWIEGATRLFKQDLISMHDCVCKYLPNRPEGMPDHDIKVSQKDHVLQCIGSGQSS